jgi:hypothetical protein
MPAPHQETYRDPRDGKTYKTVRMLDGNMWLAENLDYEVALSHPSKDRQGRYYHGQAIPDVAPPGWKVASVKDWTRMLGAHQQTLAHLQESGLNIQFAGGWAHGNTLWDGQAVYWTSSICKHVLGLFGRSSRDMVMFIDGHFSYTGDQDYFECPVRCIRT